MSNKKENEPEEEKSAAMQNYEDFLEHNSGFWNWFNIIVLLSSSLMGVGCILILKSNARSGTSCGGLRETIYVVTGMHIFNALLGLINLTKLERKCCT